VLVLTRRKDQRIMIGDDIVVTVLDVKGDTVRIGVEAPRDVQVHREEVHEALTQANLDAVLSPSAPVGLPRPPAPGPPPAAALRPAKSVRPR
jgi:carbon storage regulator